MQLLVELERIGEVRVARVVRNELLEGPTIDALGSQLLGLVNGHGPGPLLVDFARVRRMSTAVVGKLIALHLRSRAKNCRLALCQFRPEVYEIFEILKLIGFLPIYPTEQDALQALAGSCGVLS